MCDIGSKLYNRRKELGLTLEEVGDAVGVGKSTVRKWENGMIKNMGRDKIVRLAKVLQIPSVELVPDGSQDELSSDEIELVKLYRAADDRAREDAKKTLADHPREKTSHNRKYNVSVKEKPLCSFCLLP